MAKDQPKPSIDVPLDEWVRQIATHAGKEGARCVLEEHDIPKRLRRLEIVTAILIGTLGLGGLVGWLVRM